MQGRRVGSIGSIGLLAFEPIKDAFRHRLGH